MVKERVGYKAGKDGDFWMGTDDFCKEFQVPLSLSLSPSLSYTHTHTHTHTHTQAIYVC